MHCMHESTLGCPGLAARRRQPGCTGSWCPEPRLEQGATMPRSRANETTGAPGLGHVESGGAEVRERAALLGRDEQRRAHRQRHKRLACLYVHGRRHAAQPCERRRSLTSVSVLFPGKRMQHASFLVVSGATGVPHLPPVYPGFLYVLLVVCGPAGAHCFEGVSPLKSAMRRWGASMPTFAAHCSSALSAFAGAASA